MRMRETKYITRRATEVLKPFQQEARKARKAKRANWQYTSMSNDE